MPEKYLPDTPHVMRIAAWMWILYEASLAAIDLAIYAGRPAMSVVWYHLIHLIPALTFLGLAFSPWLRKKEGLVSWLGISLLSLAPILLNHLFDLRLPPAPLSNLEGMALRQLPVLLVGVALVAWKTNRFFATVIYSIAVNLLEYSVATALNRFQDPHIFAFTFVMLIRMVCFIVLGIFFHLLLVYLHHQQESLKNTNRSLSHYSAALENLTVSRERNRVSRELHDTVVHSLSGLSVQLETARAYRDVDPGTAWNLLDQSLETTRQGLAETRRVLKALRATPLEDLGLTQALRSLAEDAARRGKLKLDLTMPSGEEPLPPDVEQCLYRTAQEAIENVLHHAGAKHLSLGLALDNGAILLTVADDGAGFDPNETPTSGHYGLAGMKERADLAGGRLTVKSKPGEGTTVRLAIERSTP
ncbi:MAG: sensor histidine kinase [Anaerolineaceae bacterium]